MNAGLLATAAAYRLLDLCPEFERGPVRDTAADAIAASVFEPLARKIVAAGRCHVPFCLDDWSTAERRGLRAYALDVLSTFDALLCKAAAEIAKNSPVPQPHELNELPPEMRRDWRGRHC